MLYFYPASLTTNGKGTQMNLTLSPTDIQWLYNMYPGKIQPKTFYSQIYPGRTYNPLGKGSGGIRAYIWWIILGVVLLCGLIAFLIWFFMKKRKRGRYGYRFY